MSEENGVTVVHTSQTTLKALDVRDKLVLDTLSGTATCGLTALLFMVGAYVSLCKPPKKKQTFSYTPLLPNTVKVHSGFIVVTREAIRSNRMGVKGDE
jgi:hypothetical protein